MKRAWLVAGLVVLASASLAAQIHGTPASVTSLGGFRGGSFRNPPGVPASVTSLGPRGFQNLPCCTSAGFRNRFGGSNFVRHDGRRFDGFHHDGFRFGGFASYGYPLYGPYLGYFPLWDYSSYDPPQEQAQQQYEPVVRADVNIHDDRATQQAPEQPTQQASLREPPAPAPEQDPTVLVFRDGHKFEVRNYAIVGTTLFNF